MNIMNPPMEAEMISRISGWDWMVSRMIALQRTSSQTRAK
jgi:hypothetical protein